MIEQKPDVLFHHFHSIGSKNYLLYVCKLVEKGFKQKIQPIYIQTKNQQQAVQLDKVDKLERHVERLQIKMEDLKDKEEEIMEQHKKLFEVLENQPSTGYSYN